MRRLFFFTGLLAVLWAIDWIACEGQYSRVAWRDTREQTNSVRHRVDYWVKSIIRL